MKIKGKLILINEKPQDVVSIIAESLSPDNVSDIKTIITNDAATVIFRGEKVGTILSSVDDYLMNATIAEKLSYMCKSIE